MINWGIIGCGNVTEVKSGPAFNLIKGSKLMAVMRRNAVLAEDYAKRHNVPKFYSKASDLINDKDVNAVYIATPPVHHARYAIEVIKAGKPVYIEKPMALNYSECLKINKAAEKNKVPVFVAYYRRALPGFLRQPESATQQPQETKQAESGPDLRWLGHTRKLRGPAGGIQLHLPGQILRLCGGIVVAVNPGFTDPEHVGKRPFIRAIPEVDLQRRQAALRQRRLPRARIRHHGHRDRISDGGASAARHRAVHIGSARCNSHPGMPGSSQ